MGIPELLTAIVLGANPSSCLPASVLHYAGAALVPSLRSGPVTAQLAFYSGPAAMDKRLNQADQATMYARRANRIIWRVRGERSRTLTVRADLLGEGTRVVRVLRSGSGRFDGRLTLPVSGCWRMSVRAGKQQGTFLVRVVEPPATPVCEPSPVNRSVPHPKFGAVTWMAAAPRSSGVAAVRFVSTLPDVDNAVIYAGGRAPEGWSTKFLWWSPQRAASVELVGTRLDFPGTFRQSFQAAASVDDGEIIYPSIVNIPTAGCWAVRVRIGARAGLVVFQAVVTS